MKTGSNKLSRRYVAALRKHLKRGSGASLQQALRLGHQAVSVGLETLDLAKIHDQALATLDSSASGDRLQKRAVIFFAEAITPIEKTHRAALEDNVQLKQLNQTLGRRAVDLTAANRYLKAGIAQRKAVEKALQKSREHYTKLLKESRHIQEHLRHLSHQRLSVQEDERKKMSRELHNEIAQTLLGINVRLLTLKSVAAADNKGLNKEIASTQRLVEKSVKTMNRFAREFGITHEA
jgi:signal transduction histidine kinase